MLSHPDYCKATDLAPCRQNVSSVSTNIKCIYHLKNLKIEIDLAYCTIRPRMTIQHMRLRKKLLNHYDWLSTSQSNTLSKSNTLFSLNRFNTDSIFPLIYETWKNISLNLHLIHKNINTKLTSAVGRAY